VTLLDIAYPIAWLALFIISVTLHEAAHAWVAKRGGDLTAYAGGQVSLNPLPHIRREPLGMLVIPLISSFLLGWPFGYASTPYNAAWAHEHPRRAALMAAAGPLTHLLIVALCAAVIRLGISGGIFVQPDSVGFRHIADAGSGPTGLSVVISMLFTLNLVMLVLNLLPLPPLDGSGIVALFLSEGAARKYRAFISNPVFGFLGLLLVWRLFAPLFGLAFLQVINLVYWPTVYG
jgi:Zn-dependent protease